MITVELYDSQCYLWPRKDLLYDNWYIKILASRTTSWQQKPGVIVHCFFTLRYNTVLRELLETCNTNVQIHAYICVQTNTDMPKSMHNSSWVAMLSPSAKFKFCLYRSKTKHDYPLWDLKQGGICKGIVFWPIYAQEIKLLSDVYNVQALLSYFNQVKK